jgi:hypothetical protein
MILHSTDISIWESRIYFKDICLQIFFYAQNPQNILLYTSSIKYTETKDWNNNNINWIL